MGDLEQPPIRRIVHDRTGKVVAYEYQNFEAAVLCECTAERHGESGCLLEALDGKDHCDECERGWVK